MSLLHNVLLDLGTGRRVRWGTCTNKFFPEIWPEPTGKSCHLHTTQSGVYRNQK